MNQSPNLIQPALSHDSLLANIRQGATANDDVLRLWWLGQSGYLVQWRGAHLLLDPYLSDSLTRKYANTEKPHVRMTEIPVTPIRLDFVDIATSSHNHTDHLDGETLGPLLDANPEMTIIVSAANRQFAADRLQVSPARLTPITLGRPITVGPFTFHAVPAAHEALEQDAAGHHKFIGLVIEAGPWTLYHSGDTVRYPGMAEQLRQWPIDLAILPINGSDPKRGVAGNLSGPEAVQLALDMGARCVIPCHYDMFTFNTVSPAEFSQSAETQGQTYTILHCGEEFRLSQ